MEKNAPERPRPSIPTGSNVYMVVVTTHHNSGYVGTRFDLHLSGQQSPSANWKVN